VLLQNLALLPPGLLPLRLTPRQLPPLLLDHLLEGGDLATRPSRDLACLHAAGQRNLGTGVISEAHVRLLRCGEGGGGGDVRGPALLVEVEGVAAGICGGWGQVVGWDLGYA
jgi:hypothetical protein